jgi:hypothetical protein
MKIPILILFLALVFLAAKAAALEQADAYLGADLNFPPSLIEHVHAQEIFNVKTGHIHVVPRIDGINSDIAKSSLTNLKGRQQTSDLNQATAHLSKDEFAVFSTAENADRDGPDEILCDCTFLGNEEFIVSETPVRTPAGRYVSINDESYKAFMELIDYPLTDKFLIAVAFSELAYVYNAAALELFLRERQFALKHHRGFMNSPDYPGYRDTQYFVAESSNGLYVVVRGTSGAADVKTSLDAEPQPFLKVGLSHNGYTDVAKNIFREIEPLVRVTQKPVIAIGHSLGGSAALILSLLIADAGIRVENLNFAPVPVVDIHVSRHFEGSLQIQNFFLENEELASLEANTLFRLPGTRTSLPSVGKTAGAAHFVINYLKSMLKIHNLSVEQYSASMPDCVVIKYACFGGSRNFFVSACALNNDQCLVNQAQWLLGYPLAQDIRTYPEPTHKSVEQLIKQTLTSLEDSAITPTIERLMSLRLAYFYLLAGDTTQVEKLLNRAGTSYQSGFEGLIRRGLGRLQKGWTV